MAYERAWGAVICSTGCRHQDAFFSIKQPRTRCYRGAFGCAVFRWLMARLSTCYPASHISHFASNNAWFRGAEAEQARRRSVAALARTTADI